MTSTSMMPIFWGGNHEFDGTSGLGNLRSIFLSKIITYKHHNHLIIPYKIQIPYKKVCFFTQKLKFRG